MFSPPPRLPALDHTTETRALLKALRSSCSLSLPSTLPSGPSTLSAGEAQSFRTSLSEDRCVVLTS